MPMDLDLLRAALVGYGIERKKIEEKMAEIEHQIRKPMQTEHVTSFAKLKLVQPKKFVAHATTTPKTMSAAAKRRISRAQKARWRAFHENKRRLEEARVPAARTKKRRAA